MRGIENLVDPRDAPVLDPDDEAGRDLQGVARWMAAHRRSADIEGIRLAHAPVAPPR